MTDQTPTRLEGEPGPELVELEMPTIDADSIVVLLRCPDGGCDATLLGEYGSRIEHGPGPMHTLIPAPSGAESSTIATPSPAEVDYQVLWQNAMDRAADELRRRRIAEAKVAHVEALAASNGAWKGEKHVRVVEERNGYTVTRSAVWLDDLNAALADPEPAEINRSDVIDELLGNEISFTAHTPDGASE